MSMDLVAGNTLTPKQRKEARQAYFSIKRQCVCVCVCDSSDG